MAMAPLGLAVSASAAELEEWIKNSSFFDGKDCPAAGTLYRGVQGGFFDLGRVVRNMVGDEMAEHPSWKLSRRIFFEYPSGTMTLQAWREEKRLAAVNLMKEYSSSKERCIFFGFRAVQETFVLKPKWSYGPDTYGIPTAITYSNALHYVRDPASVVLRIDEKYPRAARVRISNPQEFDEYYIPIAIPAQDISGAWSRQYFLEKRETLEGSFQDVRIYRNRVRGQFPSDPLERGELAACVVPCAAMGECRSGPFQINADDELTGIIKALEWNNQLGQAGEPGSRFRLVGPSSCL